MDITQKLRRLSEGQNKSAIGSKVGLKPTQMNDYTNKGFKPRYDIAFKLAKALDVSIEWLLDDEADWPPQTANKKALVCQLTDQELQAEVAKRQRDTTTRLLDALDQAEKINWSDEENRTGDEWKALIPIIFPLWHWRDLLNQFDPHEAGWREHESLNGARERKEYDPKKIKSRVIELWKNKAFANVVLNIGLNKMHEDDAEIEIERELEWAGSVVCGSGPWDQWPWDQNTTSEFASPGSTPTPAPTSPPPGSPPPAPPVANAPRDTLQGKQLVSGKAKEAARLAARLIVRKAKPIGE